MKKIPISFGIVLIALSKLALAQNAPTSQDELVKQTDLLKAQQTYYDQLLQTAKSQQAATEASVATQTASLNAAANLKQAQYTHDLAFSSALKGSGLSAAVGKDGTITIAASDKTLLAFQKDSLEAIDTLSSNVCMQLTSKLPKNPANPTKAFIAPANYETIVQKSVVDIIQLTQLHGAALSGMSEFKNAQLSVAGVAIAGAIVSAEYLAGGVQTLTKLFRTDYNLAFTPTNRQGLFEQSLNMSCSGVFESNVEAKLRLNAAKILYTWIPDMARFSQMYDMFSEQVSQRKAAVTQQKTEVTALKPKDTKGINARAESLRTIGDSLKALSEQEQVLAKYKLIASSIKTYLGTINSGSVLDSLVWGQPFLYQYGGLPAEIPEIRLDKMYRFTYALNVEDASVKSAASFSSDKLRHFATAEIYYSLLSEKGDPITIGAIAHSTNPEEFEANNIKGGNYNKSY
jgi:hypothetical protein